MSSAYVHGYRIVGPCSANRRAVNWHTAFNAYAHCDQRAEVGKEAYLSAFVFDEDFRRHLSMQGSTAGFAGPCWTPWIWFDLDRAEADGGLDAARDDARRLCVCLVDQFGVAEETLLCFFSGSKGFHVGLPTAGFDPQPGEDFHRVTRSFAEGIAQRTGIVIDAGVYDKVRAFRAPNSRHAKTGLHKRRFTVDELLGMKVDAIVHLATAPEPFDVPDPASVNPAMVSAWEKAVSAVSAAQDSLQTRRAEDPRRRPRGPPQPRHARVHPGRRPSG